MIIKSKLSDDNDLLNTNSNDIIDLEKNLKDIQFSIKFNPESTSNIKKFLPINGSIIILAIILGIIVHPGLFALLAISAGLIVYSFNLDKKSKENIEANQKLKTMLENLKTEQIQKFEVQKEILFRIEINTKEENKINDKIKEIPEAHKGFRTKEIEVSIDQSEKKIREIEVEIRLKIQQKQDVEKSIKEIDISNTISKKDNLEIIISEFSAKLQELNKEKEKLLIL